MNFKLKIILVFLVLYLAMYISPKQASAQGGYVSFQVFYDDLSPYGTWILSPEYGYVWLPDLAPGFTPYGTNGYWLYTEYGWTWVSNYPWGWAPFHYGRWYTDPSYGPMWVPDNEWGPGWVSWRRSEGYYGWAPIEPGISISVAYSSGYRVPNDRWRFVRDRDFGRRDINNYYVNNTKNVTIINNSTVINNTYVDNTRKSKYNKGPDRTEVEKRAGKTFAPIPVKESNKPGQNLSNNQLQLYRPQVKKNISAGQKPVPSKVKNLKDLKPATKNQSTVHSPQSTEKNKQPVKQQPAQQQNQQPVKKHPAQQQENKRPAKQQPAQQQQNKQPVKQQPVNQQPTQQQKQPVKQQPVQQCENKQTVKQQPAQQRENKQPAKQQPAQQKENKQPVKQQPTQEQQSNPPKNTGEDKQPK